MCRSTAFAAIIFALAACADPTDGDPAKFQPSHYVTNAPWPQLVPLAELAAPPGTDAESLALLHVDNQALVIRARALNARARLASGELLTVEERARLQAAAARWTGA